MDVRVVIADDNDVYRMVLDELVQTTPGFERVGATSSGEEAVRLVDLLQPDLVLLDERMPDIDGIETASGIAALGGRHVVLLTAAPGEELLSRAQAAGVSAVVDKLSVSPGFLASVWSEASAAGAGPRTPATEE